MFTGGTYKLLKKILRQTRKILEPLLPTYILRKLLGLYGLIKPSTKSYSQKGEDILVDAFFNRRNDAYYLDIGCYHPRWISNTHILYKRGWHGTAVDIDQYKLSFFKMMRGRKVNVIQRAVVGFGESGSIAKVFKFRTKLGWSDIDTLDKKVAEDKRKSGWGEYIEEKVVMISINDLLSSLPHVDFLNIDVEGLDNEIIMALDLKKYKIEVILFEDKEFFGGSEIIQKKLQNNGYEHLFTSGGSVCYFLKKEKSSPYLSKQIHQHKVDFST
jgi:hypothetical protein